jgi:phosphoglucosamine mutase
VTQPKVEFGTDGIRGRAGEWPIVAQVGRRLGAAIGAGRRVVVGTDPRPSSGELERAVVSGVLAAGGSVVRAGVVPTAALQIALHEGLADVGVMITASHNPAPDNGFKVLLAGGRKPDDDASAAIEAALAATPDPGDRAPDSPVDPGVARAWLARLPALPAVPVVVDLANGAAAAHAEALALRWPQATFVGVGGVVNDGCGSEHLHALQAAVRERGAAAGLAVDGDADRVRLVDAAGREVPGDTITWLLARAGGVSSVAVTVMSTTALEVALPGVRVARTPVGDRFLRQVMDRDGVPLGAEDSGHVLFADHPGGDGLFAGARALAAAFGSAPSLAAATDGFRPFPRRLTKVEARERRPLTGLPAVQQAAADGERALGEGGRVFLRWSGTEPVLRLLVEGRDDAVVASVSAAVTAAARGALAGG